MKLLALAAVVMSALSCASESDMPEHRRIRTEVQIPDVRVEPESGDVQYMAISNEEERALSDWVDSRSEAESKGREYQGVHPDRTYSILWRQKPGTQKLIPKYPRG